MLKTSPCSSFKAHGKFQLLQEPWITLHFPLTKNPKEKTGLHLLCTAITHSHLSFPLVLACILPARSQFLVPPPPCCSGYQEPERAFVCSALAHWWILCSRVRYQESQTKLFHWCSSIFIIFFNYNLHSLSITFQAFPQPSSTPPPAFNFFILLSLPIFQVLS